MEEVKLRTLSVLVDNESGVLSQVSRLFSRKGFNVESLAAVSYTHLDVYKRQPDGLSRRGSGQ